MAKQQQKMQKRKVHDDVNPRMMENAFDGVLPSKKVRKLRPGQQVLIDRAKVTIEKARALDKVSALVSK